MLDLNQSSVRGLKARPGQLHRTRYGKFPCTRAERGFSIAGAILSRFPTRDRSFPVGMHPAVMDHARTALGDHIGAASLADSFGSSDLAWSNAHALSWRASEKTITDNLGSPDDMQFPSSMTLF